MEEDSKKRPLIIDWDTMHDPDDDEQPPPVVIVKKDADPPKPTSKLTNKSVREDLAYMNDHELDEAIKRHRNNYKKVGFTLPDKGEKILATVKDLEEERQQRKLQFVDMDVDECKKSTQAIDQCIADGSRCDNALPQDNSKSSLFASIFCKKMEENTDCKALSTFSEDLSTLNHCNHQKFRSNGGFSPRGDRIPSSRQQSFQYVSGLHNGEKTNLTKSDQRCTTSLHSHCRDEERSSNWLPKKDEASQFASAYGFRCRKGKTVVLVDEDECQDVERNEQQSKLTEWKDAKIYYPSRDDPESVEISYTDINCLDPEGYLTSPIMNFYIRYLWLNASPAKRAKGDYHVFNTFFYKKLKQAMTDKGSNKESSFAKFRRWWRGVNLFQKAYLLIPIHEDLHWSLVIICIPDKEDESGPIILHLDSLGLHAKRSVFDNIKSYLKDEWNYLNQGRSTYDLPIADKIWKHLPRRIGERKIDVPQQTNDYDCGLFVLFFMERFIEEAPERLKKKDLAMFDFQFGKKWFRPEEASSLRVKIRKLLLEKFQNAREGSSVPG
ncbi:hypothetical protein K2173_003237 [Erythroxylum novogranatense]|uniref:Ubiquitin-like protease family profile domain-containing protein n=1 Tax=Erythroxylum novogranatense TaxID=1862640 RepID=A0AAV8SYK5_9ROSI|nr:hypothetical protein K2173_003237 [Erythroxylum novogranatense]